MQHQQAANTSDTLPADQQSADRYNTTAHALSKLVIGTPVTSFHASNQQNDKSKLWDRSGVVVDVGSHRKYFIRLPSGRILTRNRRFLRRRYSATAATITSEQPCLSFCSCFIHQAAATEINPREENTRPTHQT